MTGFDPKKELCPLPPDECKELSDIGKTHPEMAIMVGFPGSGKTTFAKKYLVGTGVLSFALPFPQGLEPRSTPFHWPEHVFEYFRRHKWCLM
jgi:hypothetical protein